uniref:Uncharacterized protein n=1 Tax=Strigamia maritima TaxID=126957 RepID=T1J013_STRMM
MGLDEVSSVPSAEVSRPQRCPVRRGVPSAEVSRPQRCPVRRGTFLLVGIDCVGSSQYRPDHRGVPSAECPVRRGFTCDQTINKDCVNGTFPGIPIDTIQGHCFKYDNGKLTIKNKISVSVPVLSLITI